MKTRIRTNLVILLLCLSNLIYSQTTIEMIEENGVYKIPCKVNDIPLNFIFDTGASAVSISTTEALFMIKQGLISEKDIIGNSNYMTADGQIKEGTIVNLKTIQIGDIIIDNIEAIVLKETNAPLLLGQSALSKLGKFTIDSNLLIIEKNQEKNNYENEIKESSNWLNKMFEVYAVNNQVLKINYEIKEIKQSKTSGFLLYLKISEIKNNITKNSIFIIDLNEIVSANYLDDEEIDNVSNLILETEKESNGIVLYSNEKFYYMSSVNIKLCCLDLSTKDRIMKALLNITYNNNEFIKQTQKH